MTDAKKPNFSIRFQNAVVPGNATVPQVALPASGVSFRVPTMQSLQSSPLTLPNDAQACNAQGNVWIQANRVVDAIKAYDRAIELQTDYVDPHFNKGNALLRLGHIDEALAAFERAIALAPMLAVAHYNCAVVLEKLGRLLDAIKSYSTVLRLEPKNVEAQFNLGCVYLQCNAYEEAIECMNKVIAVSPRLAQAHNNRGNALLKLKKFSEAIVNFDEALALQPNYVDALTNRGNAYIQIKNYDQAFHDLEQATRINPQQAEAWHLLGMLCKEGKKHEEALGYFATAYRFKPGLPSLLSNIAHSKMTICDWKGLHSSLCQQLKNTINQKRPGVMPFPMLALLDAPDLQLQAASLFVDSEYSGIRPLGSFGLRHRRKKIRVGYYSADFHQHATTILMAELFELHDRNDFEWLAFSFGPDVNDAMRDRVRQQFDQFLDVRQLNDREIAVLSRELEIDIAVDLKGFTQDMRFGIFCYRCAPVQVSYIGYPGSSGASTIDYIIADKNVIPVGLQKYYSEAIVYLPDSYQVNDSKRLIADRCFSCEELGLPPQGVVFCCFNNNYKITPSVFDSWMRILQAVEGSVLWLLEDNPSAVKNLRREAVERGVAPERLVFAPRMPLEEHLARHRQAALFLDTLPCNAHTTASDALWAGLPVLTCAGSTFASRVAASLLHAVGLPELVVNTMQEYESRAITLGRDAKQLRALREKLQGQLPQAPLFDTRRFVRNIEAAYRAMHERAIQGLPPDTIEI